MSETSGAVKVAIALFASVRTTVSPRREMQEPPACLAILPEIVPSSMRCNITPSAAALTGLALISPSLLLSAPDNSPMTQLALNLSRPPEACTTASK